MRELAGLMPSTTRLQLPTSLKRNLAHLEAPFPPLPEQAAIVRYLDHVDERIRRYVSGKQKLIRLLEEEKQAVIHRAVTRGLDPNVRLKPSGVQWLGDIPAHWEVRRFKAMCRIRYGWGNHLVNRQTACLLIRATNVDHGRIIEKNLVYVDPSAVPTGPGCYSEGEGDHSRTKRSLYG